MKIRLLLLVLLIFLPAAAHLNAQSPEWKVFTAYDQCTGLAEDVNYIWAAINNDLVRVHKQTKEIKVFSKMNSNLPACSIISVAVDNNHVKWLGTTVGLLRFNDTTFQVINPTLLNLPFDKVIGLRVDSKNAIWMNFENYGMAKYDDTSWTFFSKSYFGNAYLRDFCIDKYNNKWLATSSGIYRYNDTTWRPFNKYDTPSNIQYVQCITSDSSGTIWCWDFFSKLITLPNSSSDSVWKRVSWGNRSVTNPSLLTLTADNKGSIWLGSVSGEIFCINQYSTKLFLTKYWDLWINKSNGSITDAEGYPWFAMKTGGLVQIKDSTIFYITHTACDLPSNCITTIAIDRHGRKWFASDYSGVSVFDHQNWVKLDTTNKRLPSNKVRGIAFENDNTTWLVSEDGFISKGKDTVFNRMLYPDKLNSIAIDAAQTKWIGTENFGLLKHYNSTWEKLYIPLPNSTPPAFNFVSIDKNSNVWGISKYTNVSNYHITQYFSCFNASGWDLFRDRPYGDYTYINMCKTDTDNATVWMSLVQNYTLYSLLKYNGTEWTEYNSNNSGLPKTVIKDIAFDKNGVIWFATENGVYRYDGTFNLVFTNLNSPLQSNSVNVVTIDAWGNKWFGTLDGGVVVYREGGILLSNELTDNQDTPQGFQLFQNYPNPFNPVTRIQFYLPKQGLVTLQIFDLLGKEVATMLHEEMNVGKHSVEFNGKHLPSGVYFYRLMSGSFVQTKKLILIK